MGPHRAVVVAERAGADRRRRQRAHAPAGEQVGRREVLGHRRGLVDVEDAGPQAPAEVAAEGVERALLVVERRGPGSRGRRARSRSRNRARRSSACARHVAAPAASPASRAKCERATRARVAQSACTSARAIGGSAEPAVGGADAGVGVAPALVAAAPVGGPLVLDPAVAVAVAALVAATRRAASTWGSSRSTSLGGQPPAPHLAEQHHEQRRRVDGAVGRPARRRTAAGGGCGPAPPRCGGRRRLPWWRARVSSTPMARSGSTSSADHAVSERVAAVQRHRPRHAGGDDGPLGHLGVEHPQGAEVVGAAGDDRRAGRRGRCAPAAGRGASAARRSAGPCSLAPRRWGSTLGAVDERRRRRR